MSYKKTKMIKSPKTKRVILQLYQGLNLESNAYFLLHLPNKRNPMNSSKNNQKNILKVNKMKTEFNLPRNNLKSTRKLLSYLPLNGISKRDRFIKPNLIAEMLSRSCKN